jgi:hypothetical protein
MTSARRVRPATAPRAACGDRKPTQGLREENFRSPAARQRAPGRNACLPRHFRDIIATLPRHFRDIFATLPRHYRDIIATSRHYRDITATLPRHFRDISATSPRHPRDEPRPPQRAANRPASQVWGQCRTVLRAVERLQGGGAQPHRAGWRIPSMTCLRHVFFRRPTTRVRNPLKLPSRLRGPRL